MLAPGVPRFAAAPEASRMALELFDTDSDRVDVLSAGGALQTLRDVVETRGSLDFKREDLPARKR
jgi:hypothetical protein